MAKKKALFIAVPIVILLAAALMYRFYFNNVDHKQLSKADIERLTQTVMLDENDGEKKLGVFNNRMVVASYECSDLCPEAGNTIIIYKDVNETECLNLKGKVLKDAAWSGYSGCYPQ